MHEYEISLGCSSAMFGIKKGDEVQGESSDGGESKAFTIDGIEESVKGIVSNLILVDESGNRFQGNYQEGNNTMKISSCPQPGDKPNLVSV